MSSWVLTPLNWLITKKDLIWKSKILRFICYMIITLSSTRSWTSKKKSRQTLFPFMMTRSPKKLKRMSGRSFRFLKVCHTGSFLCSMSQTTSLKQRKSFSSSTKVDMSWNPVKTTINLIRRRCPSCWFMISASKKCNKLISRRTRVKIHTILGFIKNSKLMKKIPWKTIFNVWRKRFRSKTWKALSFL